MISMNYFLIYLSLGILLLSIDVLTVVFQGKIYTRKPFALAFIVLLWPLALYFRTTEKNGSDELIKFEYSKTDPSLYRQFLTKESQRCGKKLNSSSLDDGQILSLAMAGIYCSVEISRAPGIQLFATIENLNNDISMFEAGCFLLYNLEPWAGSSLVASIPITRKCWSDFCVITSIAFGINEHDAHRLIESRVKNYESLKGDENGILLSYVIQSLENGSPVKSSTHVNNTISSFEIPASIELLTWHKMMVPLFKKIFEDKLSKLNK